MDLRLCWAGGSGPRGGKACLWGGCGSPQHASPHHRRPPLPTTAVTLRPAGALQAQPLPARACAAQLPGPRHARGRLHAMDADGGWERMREALMGRTGVKRGSDACAWRLVLDRQHPCSSEARWLPTNHPTNCPTACQPPQPSNRPQVWDRLDAKFWRRNREMAIRLAVQKIEDLMRRHLQVGVCDVPWALVAWAVGSGLCMGPHAPPPAGGRTGFLSYGGGGLGVYAGDALVMGGST